MALFMRYGPAMDSARWTGTWSNEYALELSLACTVQCFSLHGAYTVRDLFEDHTGWSHSCTIVASVAALPSLAWEYAQIAVEAGQRDPLDRDGRSQEETDGAPADARADALAPSRHAEA